MKELNRGKLLRELIRMVAIVMAFTVSGCVAVGPRYVPPDIKVPEAWHSLQKEQAGTREDRSTDLVAWWTSLHDVQLNELMDRAIVGNLDLKKARASLREARARRNVAGAGLFPTIDATGSAARSRGSENTGSAQTAELYHLGFDASWEADLFGGLRHAIEASQMDLEASEEVLRDTLVSLLSEVALNYVEVRAYQMRLTAAEANLAAQQETWQLTVWRCEAGLSDSLAVEQALYNLENTRSQVPNLKAGLAEAMNRLAVLIGEKPGALNRELEKRSTVPTTSIEIASGIPADVLRRRPDVRQAERQLAAQTARIGEATADLYPKLILNGTIGLEALSRGDLLAAASQMFNFGANVTMPIFHAGAIRQNIEIRSALQEQALIQYEKAILNALEEVENSMNAFAEEQIRRASLQSTVNAARRAVDLAQTKYKAGLSDFSAVLDAQRSLLTYDDQLVQSEAAVTSDLIRLYKALGGGWESIAPVNSRAPR